MSHSTYHQLVLGWKPIYLHTGHVTRFFVGSRGTSLSGKEADLLREISERRSSIGANGGAGDWTESCGGSGDGVLSEARFCREKKIWSIENWPDIAERVNEVVVEASDSNSYIVSPHNSRWLRILLVEEGNGELGNYAAY